MNRGPSTGFGLTEASGDLGKRGFSGGVVLKEGLGWAQGRIQR